MLIKLHRVNQNDWLIRVLNHPAASNNNLAPAWSYINTKLRVNLWWNFLKQDKVIFTQKQLVNIYIVFEIHLWPFNVGRDFVLGNSLFGVVKLAKNVDSDKYKYSGYAIGFGARGCFPLWDGSGFW